MPSIRNFLVLSLAGSALAVAAPSAMADSPVEAGSDEGAPLVGDFEGTPGVVDSDSSAPPLPEEELAGAPLVGDFEGTPPAEESSSAAAEEGAPPVGDFEGTPGVVDSAPPSEGDPLPGGDPAPAGPKETVAVHMVAANSTYRVSYRRAARHHHRHHHKAVR